MKKISLYLDSGYINIPSIVSCGMPFIFATGGRGTGKTYGVTDWLNDTGYKFIYMRRTQSELESCWSDEEVNPFKKWNADHDRTIGIIKHSKYTGWICDREADENGKLKQTGPVLGVAIALSTFANVRGFNGEDFDVLFYDEFIPERHVRPIKEEAFAFFNVIETINRNRELEGRKPLQVICMSNANKLDNPLYMYMGVVSKVDRMKKECQEVSIMPSRGLCLINLERSPISERKRDTALYRLTKGSQFESMSLDNSYIGEDDRQYIGSKPLAEYTPLVAPGEICIYRHKSKHEFYISTHTAGNPVRYMTSDSDLARFKKAYGWLWLEYLNGRIFFEERICEMLLTKYYNM